MTGHILSKKYLVLEQDLIYTADNVLTTTWVEISTLKDKLSVAKLIVPDWMVESARQHMKPGGPVRQPYLWRLSTLSPQSGTTNLATGLGWRGDNIN